MDFNKLFHADETKVGALLPEMDRLLHKLMAKFVPLRLLRGQTDLREVKFDLRENQHDDANVAIGMAARTFMEEEDFGPAQQAKFICEVHRFYTAVLQKMVQHFPFGDAVLEDLAILDISRHTDYTYSPGMY
ncbi:hypothetical protein NP493_989g02021 [Ridgeia piscesae]|uniref:Uncharacterized protein n=1 Tax=Ridgeia piscesae TaxID=27915 RepID=A0AAD9KIE9_RIDPI|nr:hypothetical protein NP493_989g02021 [Ridgeia piscesae]